MCIAKKTKGIVVIASLLLAASIFLLFWSLISYCTYSEIFSTYKFGISKKDYPEYFAGEYSKINPNYGETIEGTNDYSPLTKVKMLFNDKFQLIPIEHLVRVIEYDIKLIPEIKNKNHLFFGIEFENGNVNSISVTHEFEGQKLEMVGAYIYHYPMKPNGEIDDNKVFNVTKLTTDSINETGRFVYVKIYKMPKLQSNWLYQHAIRKRYWFNSPVKETIIVNYTDKGILKKVIYKFDLYWIIRDSLWSRFINIT